MVSGAQEDLGRDLAGEIMEVQEKGHCCWEDVFYSGKRK